MLTAHTAERGKRPDPRQIKADDAVSSQHVPMKSGQRRPQRGIIGGAAPKILADWPRPYPIFETTTVTLPVAKLGTSSTIFFHSGIAVTCFMCSGLSNHISAMR